MDVYHILWDWFVPPPRYIAPKATRLHADAHTHIIHHLTPACRVCVVVLCIASKLVMVWGEEVC